MLSKMKSSILLRTIQQNFKLYSRCRLPLLSNISCQPLRIQTSVIYFSLFTLDEFNCILNETNFHLQAPLFELSKRSYSSQKVANLEKIYTGPAGNRIFLLKIMSITTSVTAVVLEISLFTSDMSVATKVGWSFAGLFTFSTPFLGHIVLRKYVTEMYYDDTNDSYTAVMYTIFATKKYVSFC